MYSLSLSLLLGIVSFSNKGCVWLKQLIFANKISIKIQTNANLLFEYYVHRPGNPIHQNP